MGRHGGRRVVASAVGVAMVVGGLAPGPTPAGAAPGNSDALVFIEPDGSIGVTRNDVISWAEHISFFDAALEGDFSADPGTDIFLHTGSTGADGIVHVAPDGAGAHITFRSETVNGTYPQAMVGDFDANGLDDIFWYGSGNSSPESIWLFQPDGSHTTVWTSISGQYLPFVMDTNGDGFDDIVWYGYGERFDSIWTFGPGAGHTKRSLTVNGRYTPIVGHFGGVPGDGDQEQVIWFDDLGPDTVWTFTPTGKVQRSLPNEAKATPVVGDLGGNANDAVYWYRPGSARDTTTGFADGGSPIQVDVPQVNGTYDPVVGDFDGDGHDDIAWTWDGKASVWHASPTLLTYRQSYVDFGAGPSHAAVTHPTQIPVVD